MMQSNTKPKVGCLHFKSTVKQIRAENNTFTSSINDIIDNIHGLASKLKIPGICDIHLLYDDQQNMYKVLISDNIPHGFKDIFNQGIDNPLNMGHIRLGHDDDDETSEFGTGFKKDIIYIAQFTEIYTRSVQENGIISFLKISFDIPEMCSRMNPEESYEPTNFEVISEEQFKQNHKFDEGSTIILSNLRQTDVTFDMETGKRITNTQFEKQFRSQISQANSGLIRDGIISITVNNINVEPEPDLFDFVPKTNKSIFVLFCELNHKNEPCEIYREGLTETGRSTIMKYNPRENKFKKSIINELNVFKQRPSVYKLDLSSLTTKHTNYESSRQYNDLTDIVRAKRCFGSYKITKQEKDGYSNHIYNRLSYTSKKLNTLIGVGSNKRVDPKSNMLMSAIHITQRETTCKFRKFAKSGTLDLQESDSDESIIVSVKTKSVKKKPLPLVVVNQIPIPKPQVELVINEDIENVSPEVQVKEIVDIAIEKVVTQVSNNCISEKVEEKVEEVIVTNIFIKLQQMKETANSNEVLEKVTNIILKYVETPAINILMQYIPMDNSRIQILLDLIERKYGSNHNVLHESLLDL